MNDHIRWAVSRWEAEVKNRPLRNIHRRTLDTTWRQVICHYGGDAEGLCGPTHDELLEATPTTTAEEQFTIAIREIGAIATDVLKRHNIRP